jgi:hypothetical protein
MGNPTISKKRDTSVLVADNARQLFQEVYQENNKPKELDDEIPKIRVSEIISKMAFYYEKIRNTVDYKEEYLLRKNAIERILRRQIVIEGAIANKEAAVKELSEHLLTELIRAGYLPNNSLPETLIGEIGVLIEKYLKLKKYGVDPISSKMQDKSQLVGWVLALAATDIEERLGRNQVEATVVRHMYEILQKNIKLQDDSPYHKDKEIQIYIGIFRNYLKYDNDMLSYILFKYYHPHWDSADESAIESIGHDLVHLKEQIDKQVDHPLHGQMNRIISRYTVFYNILIDVIEEDPVNVYESFKKDPKAFPRKIRHMANKRYSVAKSKLWRAGVRSILYIFITKSIFAALLEVPATQFMGQEINNLSLAINIAFPAVLLFLIILFTRIPSDANSAKIIDGINEIVLVGHERKDPYLLRTPKERSKGTQTVFGVIYAITFLISFGVVVSVLRQINFNIVSIIIFLFFLTLVSFFSIRIRKGAKELVVIEPRESGFSFLVDFFYVPIVSAGKWLSENFSRINVFVFILDFVIEAPFKIFVSIAEDWTKYVKERKDEIV